MSTRTVGILCLLLGGALGFGAGVLAVKEGREFLVGAFRSEQKANVEKPATLDRPTFRFDYAGNWSVDTKDKDYDPDHGFSIDSPGQSFVMFQIMDSTALPPKDVVASHVSVQTAKIMKDPQKTPFTRWGSYAGEGVLLKGKHLGVTPGTIRIFAFQAGERTYTVVESTYDDDRTSVEPGFQLIERTFRAKGAADGAPP